MSHFEYEDLEYTTFLRQKNVSPPKGFGVVRPTLKNVYNSLKKFDVEKTWKLRDDVARLAEVWLHQHFAHIMGQCDVTPYKDVRVEPGTSCGYPLSRKFFNKGVFLGWRNMEEYMKLYEVELPEPVWKVSGKTEYLPLSKIIDENKIRTFIAPPMDFLMLESKWFDTMEKKIMEGKVRTWSRLGFVKERGGWSDLAASLNSWVWKAMWDVRGWDRKFLDKLFEICQRLRERFLREGLLPNPQWDHIWQNIKSSWVLLPNGQFVLLNIGQRSGDKMTSTNNTIAHIFILFVHYILWCEWMEISPKYEDCMAAWGPNVYSDDNVVGTNFKSLVDEELLKQTYSLFGMDIHEYKCSQELEDMCFLGAYFRQMDVGGTRTWVPWYDQVRSEYALCYQDEPYDDNLRAERLCGILHNTCFSEVGERVVDYCHKLVDEGRWPNRPFPSIYKERLSYTSFEAKAENFTDFCLSPCSF